MDQNLIKIRNKIALKPENLKIAIVTPVYKNDPSPLLDAIVKELTTSEIKNDIEFVLIDDGSQDSSLSQILEEKIMAMPIAALFLQFKQNCGRSAARNALIENSVAPYILFLDSDMLPDCPNFIAKWRDFIDRTGPTIAYGGFSMRQASQEKKYALARELAGRIDCLNALERNERGPVAVATSNLLVRREIMQLVPFDNGFVGWGWEDVDWALRANAAKYAVVHFENAATHLGIDAAEVILHKFKNAAPNFRHITSRHPQMLYLGSTRLARWFSHIPLLTLFAPIAKWFALCEALPVKIRAAGARLWRIIWAANSLRSKTPQ